MTKTPSDWAFLFGLDAAGVLNAASTAAPGILILEVHEALDRFGAGALSTTALVDLLWPAKYATGLAAEARKKMFDLLLELARRGQFSDCSRKSETENVRFGKKFHPWIWYRPIQKAEAAEPTETLHTCPNCGQQF